MRHKEPYPSRFNRDGRALKIFTALLKFYLLCYTKFMGRIITSTKIAQIQKLAAKEREIVAGYLFGSYASNRQRLTSDLDLGFICYAKKDINVLSFSLVVGKLFLPLETDVVVSDLTDSPLILSQMMSGRLIYQKNLEHRITLEGRIVKLYEDYLHLQNIKNIYLNQSFTKGIYAHK